MNQNEILSEPINSKKKINSKIKYVKLLLFISLILFLLLIIILFAKFFPIKNKQKRNLQYNYDHHKKIDNQRTKNGEDEDNTSMAITTYYGTYILLSLYIIGEIKFHSAGRPENLSIEVWKYIYMSNNGYLIFFIFITPILRDKMIYSCLSVSFCICIGGTIYYVCKIIKSTFEGFIDTYFSFSGLLSWFYLPCISVWPFIGLTDPCCMQSLYIQSFHVGGFVNIRYAVFIWNYFIWFLKRFSILLSTILYYWFLIYLSIVWAIIKLIIYLNLSCKKSRPVVIVPNPQNVIGVNNLNNGDNMLPPNDMQNMEPIQINVVNQLNILNVNSTKGNNNNIGEENVLKMGKQNYNNSQNSISSIQLMNNNKSRNIYLENANRKAEEDIYKTPITTPAYEGNINLKNNDINYGNPTLIQTKTDRVFKPIDNEKNDDNQAAPPLVMKSMSENDLPSESMVYNSKK